jgi:hypothetical protein
MPVPSPLLSDARSLACLPGRHRLAQLGLEITDHPILAVKMGYLVPELEQLCRINLMALTPGAVFADLPTLAYTRWVSPHPHPHAGRKVTVYPDWRQPEPVCSGGLGMLTKKHTEL